MKLVLHSVAAVLLALGAIGAAPGGQAATKIVIGDPNFEPQPIAFAKFVAPPDLAGVAEEVRAVAAADLERSGLFRIIPDKAHIGTIADFDKVPAFKDWRTINATTLVTGSVALTEDGLLRIQYRVFDVASEEQLRAKEIIAAREQWRRISHRLADGTYTVLTGEGAYFDSQVAFIHESGPKNARRKRLAVMDQDGANVRFLPSGASLAISPRFSPDGSKLLYISFDSGSPEVFLLDLASRSRRRLGSFPGMSFAPQFSPDGASIVLSVAVGGNTDLWAVDLAGGTRRRLTRAPSIETSPSYSPDGSQIVFVSDRSGKSQLYAMPAGGGTATRISFGAGSYRTPVWSPKGDLIAFTKIAAGRFHIGVMRKDGSDERLLTTSFLDESPSFSPNGRVVMFYRESPGAAGRAQVMSIDVSGINLRRVRTPGAASDPAWSPLRK